MASGSAAIAESSPSSVGSIDAKTSGAGEGLDMRDELYGPLAGRIRPRRERRSSVCLRTSESRAGARRAAPLAGGESTLAYPRLTALQPKGTPLAVPQTMWRPGPALAAAITCAAVAGCFQPAFDECRVACTTNDDCAPGHACGAAGLCAAADEPMACGGPAVPDAAVASPLGKFDLVLTYQENVCELPGWGGAATGFALEIKEKGQTNLEAKPQGSAAGLFMSWLGDDSFEGPTQGARLQLVLTGKKFTQQRGCSYTFDVTLDATVSADATGDRLEGSLLYRARTNGSLACGTLNSCTSRQAVRGSRMAMPMPMP